MPDKKEKILKFKESEREMFAVAEEGNETPLIGITGYGLSFIYDEKRLETMDQLQAAADSLAGQIIQFILDKSLPEPGSVQE